MSLELKMPEGLVHCLESFARMFSLQGEAERPVRLFASCELLRSSVGLVRPIDEMLLFEQNLESLRQRLDPFHFDNIWLAGRNISVEQNAAMIIEDPAFSKV